MHSGGGDPGQGSNREGDIRKGKYSRDKDSRQWRDEGRMREDKLGKGAPRQVHCLFQLWSKTPQALGMP